MLFTLGAILFLMAEIASVNRQYQHLINVEFRKQELARAMESSLLKQVQEYKNVLIRGHDPHELEKHKMAYFKYELEVQKHRDDLKKIIADPRVVDLHAAFTDGHDKLGQSYRKAMDAFAAGKGDAKAADMIAKGIDRPVVDTIERMLEVLRTHVVDAERDLNALLA
ncbi:MAG: hypothetical protein L0219_19575, partial [Phycisphaerales bacterium]|nr:hypothetical protein [Phycisphaerales bacterium]